MSTVTIFSSIIRELFPSGAEVITTNPSLNVLGYTTKVISRDVMSETLGVSVKCDVIIYGYLFDTLTDDSQSRMIIKGLKPNYITSKSLIPEYVKIIRGDNCIYTYVKDSRGQEAMIIDECRQLIRSMSS